VELPLPRYILQFTHAATFECEPRARDKFSDGAADKDLSGGCLPTNSGRSVDGDTFVAAIHALAFACVNSDSHLEPG